MDRPREEERKNFVMGERKRPGAATDPQDLNQTASKVKKLTPESDVHSINCSICLKSITTETIGKPDSCDHQFCLTCLLEWSKTNNSCPIDRERFKKIYFTNQSHGKYEGHCTVADVDPENEEDIEDDDDISPWCSICAQDLEGMVRVCYSCRFHAVHLGCWEASPDLQHWCCDECIVIQGARQVMEARQERNSIPGEELTVEEEEGIDAFWEAVEAYDEDHDRRTRLRRDLQTVGEDVQLVGRVLEEVGGWLDARESHTDTLIYSHELNNNLIESLHSLDKWADFRESAGGSLDEYIEYGQSMLAKIDKSAAIVQETLESEVNLIADLEEDLKFELAALLIDSDEEETETDA